MQHGEVDLCIVGTDRTTACGDVANKIGTYLKALAAHDNGVPFYVALPSPTIDWAIEDGAEIPIEERDPREVTHIAGWSEDGAAGRGAADAGGQPGGELRLRRDAGAAGHRRSSPSAASAPPRARACSAFFRNAAITPHKQPRNEAGNDSRGGRERPAGNCCRRGDRVGVYRLRRAPRRAGADRDAASPARGCRQRQAGAHRRHPRDAFRRHLGETASQLLSIKT